MHFLRIIPLLAISLSGLLCACSNDSSGDTKSNDQETTTDIPANDSNINDSARLALIEKLIETEQYNTALHHANQLLKKNPDNPAFLFIKADMLERMSDTINAIAFYKKASAEAGNFLQADMKLLNLYTESRHPETIKLADSLLTRTDTEKYQSDILLMKGIYYTKKGLLKQAENIFSFIIKNNYSYLDAYIEKGLLYYDQQRYTEALQVFELSTTVKNDFADGYFWQAKTHLLLNNKEAAILNFKKSLLLDPSLTEAREQLKSLGAIQ